LPGGSVPRTVEIREVTWSVALTKERIDAVAKDRSVTRGNVERA
jgi:hypothetical protein